MKVTILILTNILITTLALLKLKKIMTNQERLDAANAATLAAVQGIGADFQAFIQEVKDAQGGSVSEESIAAAEANAAALTSLDASKVEETPEA